MGSRAKLTSPRLCPQRHQPVWYTSRGSRGNSNITKKMRMTRFRPQEIYIALCLSPGCCGLRCCRGCCYFCCYVPSDFCVFLRTGIVPMRRNAYLLRLAASFACPALPFDANAHSAFADDDAREHRLLGKAGRRRDRSGRCCLRGGN